MRRPCSSVEQGRISVLAGVALDTDEVRYRLLKLIQQQPDIDQRGLAKALGVSLGRTNYCLRALIEKGYVKFNNFRQSSSKGQYRYVLTPAGLHARARQTASFLQRKREEYELLRREIEVLASELALQQASEQTSGEPGFERRDLSSTRGTR